MCLIGIAYKNHPRYELVLAANRDEFHHRATAEAGYWRDAPEIYGGRDLVQGGGWLALSKQRRLAAVTNVRRMVPPDPKAPSRGALVANFVRGTDSAQVFAEALQANAARYAGYNLLLWDGDALLYLTNEPRFTVQRIAPGIHGVSNATLDTPWPKLRRLTTGMRNWIGKNDGDEDELYDLLLDHRAVVDSDLPDTGVGREMERFLAPAFIIGDGYGTRASSVVMIEKDSAMFRERRFGPEGMPLGESRAVIKWSA